MSYTTINLTMAMATDMVMITVMVAIGKSTIMAKDCHMNHHHHHSSKDCHKNPHHHPSMSHTATTHTSHHLMSLNMSMSGHHHNNYITVGWTTVRTITTAIMAMEISHQCLVMKIQTLVG